MRVVTYKGGDNREKERYSIDIKRRDLKHINVKNKFNYFL